MPSSSVINDKQQLSFIYQPGVGLYDKKMTTATGIDERRLSFDLSPATSLDGLSSPDSKINNSHKSCLTRQKEQESLPIRQKQLSSNEILSDKNKLNSSQNYPIKSFDVNISSNQENHQKRRLDQNLNSNKKLRHTASLIKNLSHSKEQEQSDTCSKSRSSTDENFKCEKLETRSSIIEEQRNKSSRLNGNEHLEKPSIAKMIKNNSMVKKSPTESTKTESITSEKEIHAISSQGLLLCPKEDPMKKKKKKKIASTIVSSTELLDDDPVLDSILFNEMQSVQQQWQQFLILTMEKELNINPSDGKKKYKMPKFNRTTEFLLAYENLYDFEGMKHWYPVAK